MPSWIKLRGGIAVFCITLIVLLGASQNAWAFTPEQENRYLTGKAALKSQDYPKAVDLFGELLKEIKLNNEDRWQLLVALAVTYDKAEEWVSALEYYERFLRALTPQLAESDQKWRDRYELAVQTRHDLQARLSKTHTRVSLDSEPQGAMVWIDGTAAGVDKDARTPFVAYVVPGEHVFSLISQGPRGTSRAEKVMSITLNQPQSWMASMRENAAVLDAVKAPSTMGSTDLVRPYNTLGWTVLGSGIASGLGGLIFSVQALGTHDELGRLSVTPTADPEGSQQRWNSLQGDLDSQELTSWVLYGVGAALLGTGVGLLTIEEEEESDSAQENSSPVFWGTGMRWVF